MGVDEKYIAKWMDPKMMHVLEIIQNDARYIEGITYGMPRPGHDEGSVANHIAELDATVEKLRPILSDDEYWKLRLLVHVHDTFKLEGKRRTGHQVSLLDEDSHASIGARFMKEITGDHELTAIVQFHDEGFALYQKFQKGKGFDRKRLCKNVIDNDEIKDMTLYLLFTVVDGFTVSKMKDRSPRWFVNFVNEYIKTPRVYDAMELLGI